MKFFILLFFLITTQQCKSQPQVEPKIRELIPLYMGDSLNKIKNNIFCMEAQWYNQPYSDSSTCRNYQYKPQTKESLTISNVKFLGLIFDIESNKTVRTITLFKTYNQADLRKTKKKSKGEFDNLTIFLNKFLQQLGKNKSVKDDYNIEKQVEWRKDKIVILLRYVNRKNYKVPTVLEISFFKE